MNAMNRTNRHGLRFFLSEVPNNPGTTRVKLEGTTKEILIRVPIQQINDGWFAWKAGSVVQEAFPFLSADEREFLMTGITKDEWDQLFKERE